MSHRLQNREQLPAPQRASREIASPVLHAVKTCAKGGRCVDRSVDRFTGCPDISRRHRLGWHRGHKASSLNGVFLSSDCDSGIQKKEESTCFIRPQQNNQLRTRPLQKKSVTAPTRFTSSVAG